MDEEFQSHLEMLADRFVSQGMTIIRFDKSG